MKQHLLLAILFFLIVPCHAQNAGMAGGFARMGFGARGMGMGNSLSAVPVGEMNTFYNPALGALSEHRTVAASFGILALDRYLNCLSYTQAIKPTAGISIGLINAGVRDIDGRDSDGEPTEAYSTSENQFYLSFSNRIEDHLSIGVTIKLYHGSLFEKVTSTTVGFDVGALLRVADNLSLGAVVQDINSKYKWDTKEIYGKDGKSTEDKFPMLRRVGIAYSLPMQTGIISGEFENSSQGTNILRFGAEYAMTENFSVRGGMDRLDVGSAATGVKPTFGFSLKNSFNGWTPMINYAYIVESFAPRGMHILTLSMEL